MNALLYVISIVASFIIVYFVAKKIEDGWEKGAWLAMLWLAGVGSAFGLSYFIHSKLIEVFNTTNDPTTITIVYFITFFIVVTAALVAVGLISKKINSDQLWIKILLWYAVIVLMTSWFLHIFKLTSNLTQYFNVVGLVIVITTIFAGVVYWRPGKENGVQYYFGVITAHVLAVIMTCWLFWALGIANMENLNTNRGIMIPFIMFYVSYITLAFIISLGAKPLRKRWSYRLNWLWCAAINVLCLLTVILQLAGLISAYEMTLVRYKNISSAMSFHAKISEVFNESRFGYTFDDIEKRFDTGITDATEVINIEKSVNVHLSEYYKVPKPEIVFPAVYQNNLGWLTNSSLRIINRMYASYKANQYDKNIDKIAERQRQDLSVYDETGMTPEQSAGVIKKYEKTDVSSLTPEERQELDDAHAAREMSMNNASGSIPRASDTTNEPSRTWQVDTKGRLVVKLEKGEKTTYPFFLKKGESTPVIVIPDDNYHFRFDNTAPHLRINDNGKIINLGIEETMYLDMLVVPGDRWIQFTALEPATQITFQVWRDN